MKTKNIIAAWLLVLWILVTGSKPYFALLDALQTSRPTNIILWDAAVALFVGVSGLFLIVRFFYMLTDLEHYEAQERKRMEEVDSRRDDN